VANRKINPARSISGPVILPGDKSISHRYAMLASLAKGTSRLEHFSAAADCQSTLDCLKRLGVKIERTDSAVRITGAGLHGLQHSRRKLDAGNSGTTIRMLTGILAGQQFDSTLTGDDSLRRGNSRRRKRRCAAENSWAQTCRH
jgi:3-phosphoshikimate 1-carboxyvinyltransferase